MKNRLLIVGLFISFFSFSYAQQFLSKDQLINDIDYLYLSIKELHPDMFTVISQEDFEKELDTIKTALKDSLSTLDFYQTITPVIVKLGDGHTRLFTPVKALSDSSCSLFPFSVKIDRKDHFLVVKSSFVSDDVIVPEGSHILTINGKQSKELVNELIAYESGEKDDFRLSMLEYDFSSLLWVCYRDTAFVIEYEDQTGAFHKAIVNGIDMNQYNEKSKETNRDGDSNYSFSIDKNNAIGIVDFRSFSNSEEFAQFADSIFKEIKEEEIKDLIIDIRNNSGGNSIIGDEFFQYISPVPYQQFGKTIVNISQRLKGKVKNEDGEEIDYPTGVHTFDNSELIELRENDNHFDGNVYLLISNYTFSSATDFAWAFKYFNMGTVIGEETGGLAVCFGDMLSETLPHSGLNYGVSFKKFYCYGATDENIHGVLPDYKVNAEDAMSFAIELIKSNRNKYE